MHYTPCYVIPHSLSTLYRCSLTTVAQDKPYHEKPLIRDCFNHKYPVPFQTIFNHHSRDQLLEFCTSFYETISSEFLVQGNFKHTQFSREHWHWRDSNSQLLAPKASTVLIELTWLFVNICDAEVSSHLLSDICVCFVLFLLLLLVFFCKRYNYWYENFQAHFFVAQIHTMLYSDQGGWYFWLFCMLYMLFFYMF